MQRLTLTGRLTRDPELRELPDGGSVCKLRLAVDDMARGRETGYINVSTFGKPGEAAAKVLSTGWLVAVDGRLEYHEWEQDGKTRHDYEVIGSVEFLAAPRAAPRPQSPSSPCRPPPDHQRAGRQSGWRPAHDPPHPGTPCTATKPTLPPSSYRVLVTDHITPGLASGDGRHYESPPQTEQQARSLAGGARRRRAPRPRRPVAPGDRRRPADRRTAAPTHDRPRDRSGPLPADPRRRQPQPGG